MQLIESVRKVQDNPEILEVGQEVFQQFLSRSATDMEFRRKLLTSPRAAVEEYTGRELPESWNVQFIENGGTTTIVLPDAIDATAELSAEELESVSGGTSPSCLGVAASLLALYDALIDDR